MNNHQHGQLFQWAIRVLCLFLMVVLGVMIACLIAIVFDGFPLVEWLVHGLVRGLLRLGVVVSCLMFLGVVDESLR